MLSLIHKECKLLYSQSYSWFLLAIACFVLAWSFLLQLENFQQLLSQGSQQLDTNYIIVPALFNNAALVGLLLTAALSQRLLSNEQKNGILMRLFASPISHITIIFSKIFIILAMLLPILLFTVAMALSLSLGTQLDYGVVGSNTLAITSLYILYASFAVFCSSLTQQSALASGLFVVGSLVLWLVNGTSGSLFAWLGIQPHLNALSSGLINSADLLYFIILSWLFIHMSVYRLERLREQ